MQNHLVIMAKRPSMGRVKTRLAKKIGNVEAYKFFNNNLKKLMRKFRQNEQFKLHIATTPKAAVNDSFWLENINIIDQGSGDLGARMNKAFVEIHTKFGGGRILIIGSDIPYIQLHHIMHGFKVLKNKKICFGASDDGGYWLVGQRSTPQLADLFKHVRWSSEFTLLDSVANANRVDIGYAETLNDVDNIEDYRSYLKSLN